MIQKVNIKAWEINQVYRFSARRGYTIEYGTSQKNIMINSSSVPSPFR